jgi:hypothetical protein
VRIEYSPPQTAPLPRKFTIPISSQDLLKHTPVDHPDYPLLQDALRISQNFLSSINEDIDPRRTAVTTPKGEVSYRLYTALE